MGEKRIDELNDAQYPSYYHYLPIDRDVAAETAKLKADYFGRANDSSDIRCLGNTNTTGAIISSGKYFYKYDSYHSNRALAKAIANIAVNSILTENTNFKYVTIGEELDSLNTALNNITISDQIPLTGASVGTGSLVYFRIGKFVIVVGNITAGQNIATVNGVWNGLPTPLTQFDAPTEAGVGKVVQLRADGGLRNYATVNGTSHFNFVYLTND